MLHQEHRCDTVLGLTASVPALNLNASTRLWDSQGCPCLEPLSSPRNKVLLLTLTPLLPLLLCPATDCRTADCTHECILPSA